jgi:hypothetical protein
MASRSWVGGAARALGAAATKAASVTSNTTTRCFIVPFPPEDAMQCRLRLGLGGSLARSAAPAGELQTAKRHRNRVRAAGRSRVRGGLGDPIPYRRGRGGVRCGFGGAPCARVPAPLMPTPMPPFAPQAPHGHRLATAVDKLPACRIDGLVCSARNALRAPRDHSCREVWKQGSYTCHYAKSSSNNSRGRTAPG